MAVNKLSVRPISIWLSSTIKFRNQNHSFIFLLYPASFQKFSGNLGFLHVKSELLKTIRWETENKCFRKFPYFVIWDLSFIFIQPIIVMLNTSRISASLKNYKCFKTAIGVLVNTSNTWPIIVHSFIYFETPVGLRTVSCTSSVLKFLSQELEVCEVKNRKNQFLFSSIFHSNGEYLALKIWISKLNSVSLPLPGEGDLSEL